MFAYLGGDLPGALEAKPISLEEVPDSALNTHGKAKAVPFEKVTQANKFSSAGGQLGRALIEPSNFGVHYYRLVILVTICFYIVIPFLEGIT